MENKGLLFIPDISGFTRFINETEISHSRLIVQELLEVLISSNQLGLEVSEIEGDAILFYKYGESPDLKELFNQVKKMFSEFHKNILSYDNRRYCQCKACISAIDLTLKVITHYGEFTGYSVRNFNKLIGKDVIVAHQLLKNDIEDHEYWLVTPPLAEQDNPPAGLTEWMKWMSSSKQTENGKIPFHYTQLTSLKNEITLEPFPKLDLSNKIKILTLSKEYEAGIINLFHASGDFRNRSRWFEGVKMVEEVNHFLPRVGMSCRCILENGQINIYSSSYSFSPDKIEISESDEKEKCSIYYTLEKISDRKSKLTLDYYLKKNIAGHIKFNMMRKKRIEDIFQKSLNNLEVLVKEIKLPGDKNHSH